MISITKGNDFKLIATFTRGGEQYKFSSVTAVNLFQGASTKFAQKFSYADGTLTVSGSCALPTGTYGVEVVGKEGGSQRRTAYPKVLVITSSTTAGTYDPEEEVDDYDIAMHVEVDMSADEEATDSAEETAEDTGSEAETDE